MKTKIIDYLDINELKKELQSLKNRIDLIEAALDIQEWKQAQSEFPEELQTNNHEDLKQK